MPTTQSGWPIGASSPSFASAEEQVFVLELGLCVFQVPGGSAARPAQPAGGAAEEPAAAAQPGRLRLSCWDTLSAISCKDTENITI